MLTGSQYSGMRFSAKPFIETIRTAAMLVALMPYFHFLITPSAESATLWLMTVAALGMWGFTATMLKQLRAKERSVDAS